MSRYWPAEEVPADGSALFGSFARAVSELADGTDAEIAACPDQDMQECAQMLRAARQVARAHFKARNSR